MIKDKLKIDNGSNKNKINPLKANPSNAVKRCFLSIKVKNKQKRDRKALIEKFNK